jgi:aminoglycoside phosphotransferase (APT) family kinase protein
MTSFKYGPECAARLAAFNEGRRSIFYPKTDLPLTRDELLKFQNEREERAGKCQIALQEAVGILQGKFQVSRWKMGTFHCLFQARGDSGGWVIRAGLLPEVFAGFNLLVEPAVALSLPPRVSLPEFVLVDLSREKMPFDYQVMKETVGEPVRDLEDPETQRLPEPVLEQVGAALSVAHSVETRGFGLVKVPLAQERGAAGKMEGILSRWSDYVFLNLEEHLRRCGEAGAVDKKEADEIARAFEQARPVFDQAPSRLLHGDYGHQNILLCNGRISGILDWEDALCGDPIFDVAYWGTFCREWMREPFLRGYQGEAKLPPDFEVRYWVYYLRIALSKTAHRALFGTVDRPGRPPASARVQLALGHLRKLLG